MKKVILSLICILIFLCTSCSTPGDSKNDGVENSPKSTVKETETEVFNEEDQESGQEFDESEPLFPAFIQKDNKKKWGYINNSGKFVIEPSYDYAYNFTTNGVAVTSYNNEGDPYSYTGTINVINKKGEIIAGPYKDMALSDFKDNLLLITDNSGTSIVINDKGEKLLETSHNIREYGEDMFVFSQEEDNEVYFGYLDMNGNIAIPARYDYARPFKGDIAFATLKDGEYAIINKSGVIMETYEQHLDISNYIGDLKPFWNAGTKKWGFKSKTGQVVIDAMFTYIEPFTDGLAPVQCEIGEYDQRWGLINTKGEFIIKPEYSGVKYIGNGLLAVSEAHDYINDFYLPKAIFDSTGKQLTPFKYYDVGMFREGYASSSDGVSTFFIDASGNPSDELPKLEGLGTLELRDGIVCANIDNDLSYFTKDGVLIWHADTTLELENGMKVRKENFRPNYYNLITYPQIENHYSKEMQEVINKEIKERFLYGYEDRSVESEVMDEINFTVESNKGLLTVSLNGYMYPIGAAHGTPYKKLFNINLDTGKFYELKDLFIKGAEYRKRLTEIIRNKMDLNRRIRAYYYDDADPEVYDGIEYEIAPDSLIIHYQSYEIAPYVAGPQSFRISYDGIMDIIDTKGELWNSFERKKQDSDIQILDYIDSKIVDLIESAVEQYEVKLIEAVNTNDFTKVEPVLLEGSELYEAQKKLVDDLNVRGIKERLSDYEIYAITDDSEKDCYRVYVFESVEIKYPGKDYELKEFSWSYAAVYDENSGSVKLSDIKKW